MGFFSGDNHVVVPPRKKRTSTKPVFEYLPKTIAIPLKSMGSEKFDIFVEVGDYVKIGTKLAVRADHFIVPVFSSVSGVVTAIENRDHVSLKKTPHIVIENDFTDTMEEIPPWPVATRSEVCQTIRDLGIVGLGGAGFPAYIKYSNAQNVHTILLNGVECEPYISVDELYMKKSPQLLLEGLLLFMKAADAKKGIIAIKTGKPELYGILSDCLHSHFPTCNIEIYQVPNIYPIGWERALIKQVLELEYDRLPSEVGVIVNNTTSAINLAQSVKTNLPMYERYVTLSGEGFANPQNIKVRVGTILGEVVNEIGGYTNDVPENFRLVAGGPFMGGSIVTDDVAITAASNSFLCLPNYEIDPMPCLRCGKCIGRCPSGLQPVQITRETKLKNVEQLKKLAVLNCISCGTCTYVCPSFINVTESMNKAKRFYNTEINRV